MSNTIYYKAAQLVERIASHEINLDQLYQAFSADADLHAKAYDARNQCQQMLGGARSVEQVLSNLGYYLQ